MTICFFTEKSSDGIGDLIHTIKIAQFMQHAAFVHQVGCSIVIVVPNTTRALNHQQAVQQHLDAMDWDIPVYTIKELKEYVTIISACIKVCQGIMEWAPYLTGLVSENTHIIYLPEYAHQESHFTLPHCQPSLSILCGFDTENNELGIIPNENLLQFFDKTANKPIDIASSFQQIDPKIRVYLGNRHLDYIKHQQTHETYFQYSHDRMEHHTYGHSPNSPSSIQYTAVDFFLLEHFFLTQNSQKSQDIICLGNNIHAKKQALIKIKDRLIAHGYSKISFIDIDQKSKHILYNDSLLPFKEYRILYSSIVSVHTMHVLPMFTGDLVGATGDNTFAESLSAGKLITYECFAHKIDLVTGYLHAVQKKATNNEVVRLATLLMKPLNAQAKVAYAEEEIATLLSQQNIINELKDINWRLAYKSTYLARIEQLCQTALFPDEQRTTQFLSPEQTTHMAQVSENLLATVNYQKNESNQWQIRFDAATKIVQLLHQKKKNNDHYPAINLFDLLTIKKQVDIIQQHYPSTQEYSLLKKIVYKSTIHIPTLSRFLFFSTPLIQHHAEELAVFTNTLLQKGSP